MKEPYVLEISAPYVTVERYVEITKKNKNTVLKHIREGKIPVMPKSGNKEMTLINLALLTKNEAINMDQSTTIIAIAAPYVTTERYAEISGIKPGTIERKISAKKFPVLPKEGSRELNLINLALLTKHALEAKF
ncbi:hypothetical protein [Aliivibrio fischeri]|uniref:hypothetical protein n=1 Tax=Aliivibrio fischeri TaxID=668 RepID=UPI001F3382D4|nr:hypothetical protein [Aliivibrio fischeri]